MDLLSQVASAVEVIRLRTDAVPTVGLILGSGLGDFADTLENPTVIPFSDLPGFPLTTVEGHTGAFVFGARCGKSVVALQGRLHYYEGHSMQTVTLPVRIMAALGVKTLIVTNASGGVNRNFLPGTLMLLTDHINFSGANPLVGKYDSRFGPRFPDVTDLYSPELRKKIRAMALERGIDVQQGVYMMFSGPNYETPAEIRMARILGADAVGMSTVPEALVAAQCGIRVAGISCITNMAAGVLPKKLHHEEVIETAARVKETFTSLLNLILDIL